jgi:hypothetical protein
MSGTHRLIFSLALPALVLLLMLLTVDMVGGQLTPQGCALPPAGMVAWYPLDEQVGAVSVNDIAPPPGSLVNNAGTPQPGSVVGSPNGPNPAPGEVNTALYFSGPYIEVPPQTELDFGTGDFSIDAWIQPVSIVDSNFISLVVYKLDANSGAGFALFTQGNQSGGRELKLVINGTTYTSSALITSVAWYHVAVVVDRTNSTGDFYINGVSAGSFVPVSTSVTNTVPMLIGASFLAGLQLPNVGRHEITLDELELFNRALSLNEVQSISSAGAAGKCKLPHDPTHDLGDAPDSTNNASGSPAMTAYAPSTQARYPTVFSSSPPGPMHLQPKAVAWLGPNVSFEDEADVGPDQDPSNNIRPLLDQPDLDLGDDGVALPIPIPGTYCSQVAFNYTVDFAAVTAQPLYFNVWFDFTQDGDWEDSGKCAAGPSTTALFHEWAVQDQVIPPGSGPAPITIATPAFIAQRLNGGSAVWMRVTLSDQPAVDPDGSGPLSPDGRGPAGGFKYGETEDYYDLTVTDGVIVYGSAPPPAGGYGTFFFSGGAFDQLLAASGCPEETAVFFYNKPDGAFAVWIPGTDVSIVNEEFLSIFGGDPPLPYGVIFTARCL